MYPYQARFTVSSYPVGAVDWTQETVVQEYPYNNQSEYDEQRTAAHDKYNSLISDTSRVYVLSRVSMADLEEGDPTPTLLRQSDKPDYEYEGFAGI